MTRSIVLKGTAGKHLCKKLAAIQEILSFLVILQRSFRVGHVGRS